MKAIPGPTWTTSDLTPFYQKSEREIGVHSFPPFFELLISTIIIDILNDYRVNRVINGC